MFEITSVETAIPAFIGYTEKGDLILQPTRINSLIEYENLFGGANNDEPHFKISIQEVRQQVGPRANPLKDQRTFTIKPLLANPLKYTLYYQLQMFFSNGGGACYIVSVGTYQAVPNIDVSQLQEGLDALNEYDEPTLIVFADNAGTAIYPIYQAAMAQCAYLQDRFALLDVVGTTEGDIQNFKDSIGAENLRYSAAYFPALKTTLRFKYKTENITVDSYKIMTYSLRNPMGRVSQGRLPEWNEELDIFKKIKAAIDELTIELLPSGAVAGVYALVDSTRGVWKAPANVSINNVMGVTRLLNDTENGTLNVDSITGKSINAIRNFTGKGTLIWGARTLDGNSNEWRYINVRRFFIMIEESIKRAMKTFVFEPNDANIWVIVRGMIENYLTILWRQGAMMGAKPSEAFFVKVGLGETMTSLDIQEGRMIVMIGAAAVRPAEFTIITIIQQMPVLET